MSVDAILAVLGSRSASGTKIQGKICILGCLNTAQYVSGKFSFRLAVQVASWWTRVCWNIRLSLTFLCEDLSPNHRTSRFIFLPKGLTLMKLMKVTVTLFLEYPRKDFFKLEFQFIQLCLDTSKVFVPGSLTDIKMHRCSSLLYKMA